jgi:hypothetical protein
MNEGLGCGKKDGRVLPLGGNEWKFPSTILEKNSKGSHEALPCLIHCHLQHLQLLRMMWDLSSSKLHGTSPTLGKNGNVLGSR